MKQVKLDKEKKMFLKELKEKRADKVAQVRNIREMIQSQGT